MRKCSILLAVVLTLVILLAGCGNSGSYDMTENSATGDAPPMSARPDYAYDAEAGGVTDGYIVSGSTNDIYNSDNNKIIRTASMTIQTTAFDSAVTALNQLTDSLGGYFETAEMESGGYYNQYANRSAYYVVRIPKENFTAFRDGTGGIGHVYSISENTQDVGETYYDTEARLATLTTKRGRLLALLEKAEVMEEPERDDTGWWLLSKDLSSTNRNLSI